MSSISNIGNVYAQNSVTTMEYEARLENDELPIIKGLAVDDDDLLRAEVIQSLMCYDALDYDEFGKQEGPVQFTRRAPEQRVALWKKLGIDPARIRDDGSPS